MRECLNVCFSSHKAPASPLRLATLFTAMLLRCSTSAAAENDGVWRHASFD